MTAARWILPAADSRQSNALAASLGIGLPAAKVLVHRGLADPAAAGRFLHPTLDDLYDPLTIRDMPQAAERLRRAFKRRFNIPTRDYERRLTLSPADPPPAPAAGG